MKMVVFGFKSEPSITPQLSATILPIFTSIQRQVPIRGCPPMPAPCCWAIFRSVSRSGCNERQPTPSQLQSRQLHLLYESCNVCVCRTCLFCSLYRSISIPKPVVRFPEGYNGEPIVRRGPRGGRVHGPLQVLQCLYCSSEVAVSCNPAQPSHTYFRTWRRNCDTQLLGGE